MSILRITMQGESVLHTPLKAVDMKKLNQYQSLIDDMVETMHAKQGIGIAANQVGKDLQIAVISHEAWGGEEDIAIINPTLVTSPKRKLFEEGCLSVPGAVGRVQRSERVRVKTFDRHGKKMDIKAKGLLAHVLQHEYDHLQGIVFVDKAVELQLPPAMHELA